jgi:hypothetical protein
MSVSDAGYNINFLLLASTGGAKLSTINVRAKAEEVSSIETTKSKKNKKQVIMDAMNNLIFALASVLGRIVSPSSFFFTMTPLQCKV